MMEDDGSELTWTYQTFTADDKYRLNIGGGVGTRFDAMSFHNGSTYDNDNDKNGGTCAYSHQGGWWYNNCHRANLNAPHDIPPNPIVHQTFAKMMWFDGVYRDVSSSDKKKAMHTTNLLIMYRSTEH